MKTQNLWILLARISFGLIFILSGWPKLFNVAGTAARYAERGIPYALGYLAPFVEFFGGLTLIVGFATRYSALLMVAFLMIATFTSHVYWNYPEAQYAAQRSNFWKNIAMLSGAFLLFVTGGGRYSIDAKLGRNK